MQVYSFPVLDCWNVRLIKRLGNVVGFDNIFTMKKLIGIALAILCICLLIDYGVLEMYNFESALCIVFLGSHTCAGIATQIVIGLERRSEIRK